MTTAAASQLYLSQHLAEWHGKGYAVHNPHGKPIEELPVIFGFNNGGSYGWMQACLVAQDGKFFSGHVCSEEGYMPHDLGIVEGSRPDRHEIFKCHYPDGYRMEFVGYNALPGHVAINHALELSKGNPANAEEGEVA